MARYYDFIRIANKTKNNKLKKQTSNLYKYLII